MGEIFKQTASGVKWTSLESLSLRAIQFLLSIILARLLSPSDFGILGLFGIFVAIVGSFVDCGMGSALIRKKDADEQDYGTVFIYNFLMSIVAYAIMFAIAPFIADFFNQPILRPLVRVVCLNMVISSIGGVIRNKLSKTLNFKILAKISTISSLFSGVVGVVLAYCGWGVWSLAFQSVSNCILTNILTWMLSKWHPKCIWSTQSFKKLFGYGNKLMLSGLLNNAYGELTTFIIGKFYSPAALGYYYRGKGIPTMISGTITDVLQKVTFPIMSTIQDETQRLTNMYRKYIKSLSLMIFFFAILGCALAKPIIVILVTDKWLPSVPYMQVFFFIFMFDHLQRVNLTLLQVKGRSDLFLRLEAIKKALSIGMLLLAAPYGVMAICLMQLLYSQIALAINTFYTKRLINLGYWQQMKDYGPYIIFSAISSLPAYLLTFTDLNNYAICIVGGVMAVAIYWTFLKLTRDSIYQEYAVNLLFPKIKGFLKLDRAASTPLD